MSYIKMVLEDILLITLNSFINLELIFPLNFQYYISFIFYQIKVLLK